MKKLFLTRDIPLIDRGTIEEDEIDSIDLMERAATAATEWIVEEISNRRISIFCGPGNNGGDGLAIARLLKKEGRQVEVFMLTTDKLSADNKTNLDRLQTTDIRIHQAEEAININDKSVIIDCLFGTGLNREIAGLAKYYIETINKSNATIISIDMPSGLPQEKDLSGCDEMPIIKADHTLSFQFPKIAFFVPEVADYVGRWHILDIKLSRKVINDQPTQFFYNTNNDVAKLLLPRKRFSHKGTFGHALLFAGSRNMMGASILASQACMRAGAGLLTTVIPNNCNATLNISLPEAMTRNSPSEEHVVWDNSYTEIKSTAIAFGPGLGRGDEQTTLCRKIIDNFADKPMVIDADGLFAVAELVKGSPTFRFPKNTIITPHIVEFDRLTTEHTSTIDRLEDARKFATEHNVTVVLKGAFTQIINPSGEVVFNTTGNSGMATAGSGDVLTGIILGLLAQGYDTYNAALLGVGLHALAGDYTAKKYSRQAMIASDIINQIPKAYIHLNDKT